MKTVETDAAGAPIVSIQPTASVYSFFLFMAPIEEDRAPGKATTSKVLAWLIVIVALFLQGVIIYAIWKVIVLGSAEWQLSVVSPAPVGGACYKGESLCQKLEDGTVTCAPPSVQLSGRWDELDLDGDGNWTRAEAAKSKDDIFCKYHVNPVEVFDVFTTFLINRENIIWIDPSIRAGQGIPQSYFTYAAGDIIMCGYRNEKMCPNLLKKGFFDAPLTHGTVPRVGTTTESALKYCYEMLQDGGTCDRTLPSTYTVWKRSSEDQCYGVGFNKFVYEHPVSGKEKSLLAVDYSATEDYRKAEKSFLFMLYKACVIMVLLCSVFSDIREIVPHASFVLLFPSSADVESQGRPAVEKQVDPKDDDNVVYKINGITGVHRVSMAVVVAIRFIMFLVLMGVGVVFLLREVDYLNLILNGLGLLFIVVLPLDLYNQLLSPYLRSKIENVHRVEVPLRGLDSLNRNPPMKDILWLAVIIVILVASMVLYTLIVVQPVTEALQCACLSDGPRCREAKAFSETFWDDYWKKEVPRVISDIKGFEQAYKSGQPVSLHSVKAHAFPFRHVAQSQRKSKRRSRLREGIVNAPMSSP